jgi:hypothetical protein
LRGVADGEIWIEDVNAVGAAVGGKFEAVENFFAAIIGTEGDGERADDVVADLAERGGGSFAVVAVNFVVVGIVAAGIFLEDVAERSGGRERADVLLDHHRIENAGE